MNIIERLQEIFRDIFDDASITIHAQTTAKDIEDWDSLMQMQLILATETEFRIKFTTSEVMELKNVGDFVGCIEKKIK